MIKTTIVSYGGYLRKNVTTYIDHLDAHLDSYYPSISWHIFDEKIKGGTIQLLLQHLEEKVFLHHPNIVFLNISSHDMKSKSVYYMPPEVYGENFQQLLDKICKHNNRTGLNRCRPIPFVITPPPIFKSGENKYFNNDILAHYNEIIEEVVRAYNGVYIDLLSIMSKKLNYEELLEKNGLGFNQNGQDFLYDIIFIEMTKLINYQGVLKERQTFAQKRENA